MHRLRHAVRGARRTRDLDRMVEESHQPVAGRTLKRTAMRHDQCAHRRVKLTRPSLSDPTHPLTEVGLYKPVSATPAPDRTRA